MTAAIEEINRRSLGVVLITDSEHRLVGIITDGDLRRALSRKQDLSKMTVEMIMSEKPHSARVTTPAYDALNTMERFQITVLPITDDQKKVKGVLHLHDILGKGEFKFNGA